MIKKFKAELSATKALLQKHARTNKVFDVAYQKAPVIAGTAAIVGGALGGGLGILLGTKAAQAAAFGLAYGAVSASFTSYAMCYVGYKVSKMLVAKMPVSEGAVASATQNVAVELKQQQPTQNLTTSLKQQFDQKPTEVVQSQNTQSLKAAKAPQKQR